MKEKIKQVLRKSVLLYNLNLRLSALFEAGFIDGEHFLSIVGEEKFYSQHGQDLFVYYYFKKKPGVFLDVGANHPKEISNTYALEQSGWTGLAFEPQEHLNKLWKEMRTTECLPYACGKENKQVEFKICESDVLSGIASQVSGTGKIIEVTQVRIADVLRERHITHIDYMSIDVEGYEYDVLEGIDFDAVDITMISLENNKSGSRGVMKLREYMRSKGYRYIAHIVIDDIFVKI